MKKIISIIICLAIGISMFSLTSFAKEYEGSIFQDVQSSIEKIIEQIRSDEEFNSFMTEQLDRILSSPLGLSIGMPVLFPIFVLGVAPPLGVLLFPLNIILGFVLGPMIFFDYITA